MNQESLNLGVIKAVPKIGTELLTFNDKNIGYSLLDFWQWSVSDLISNATRGRLAEFIVGTAVEINPKKVRDEWDFFDIKTDNGIKIEVKSASYIQSWEQKSFSNIVFSIKKTKKVKTEFPKRYADVYVFCLLKIKDQKIINPLKLEQWEFYILPTCDINNYIRSQSSITLNSLKKITQSVSYNELKTEVYKCYTKQSEYKKFNP